MKNVCHLIDCMEFMKGLPDNAFDLAIVDPPYGHLERSRGSKSSGSCKGTNGWSGMMLKADGWDVAPTEDYFKEINRIASNQIIWGANYFSNHLKGSQGWIVWNKGQRNFSLADGELAFSSFDKALRIFDYSRAAALQDGKIHPTQKPVALYKWLLSTYAKPGDTIFDSHVGSGSIRIACHDLDFEFEGCEIDADYHAAQEARFQKHTDQLRLF